MQLLEIVRKLENRSRFERLESLIKILEWLRIDFEVQEYNTGSNLIIAPHSKQWVGISAHFDVAEGCGGANDNASGIAVCIDIARKSMEYLFKNIGVGILFFDEEEDDLIGSRAFVANAQAIKGMIGLINMEMVGKGNHFALWSVDSLQKGKVLDSFEKAAQKNGISAHRFDKIVSNAADHLPFRRAGIKDAFTLTCISDRDVEISKHYYKAQEFEVDRDTLRQIIRSAPLFEHYHTESDISTHLSEDTLQMTSKTIWNTLVDIDASLDSSPNKP